MAESSLRRALEDELAANPDDLASHAAYADLLQEEGDPRGEFIQRQLALEDPALPSDRREQLARRERELWQEHEWTWLGPLAEQYEEPITTANFRRGWLDTLEIGSLNLPLARALRDAPLARLLRHLGIDSATFDDESPEPADSVPPNDRDYPAFWPLVGASCLRNLRIFRVGKDQGDDCREYRSHHITAVFPLVRSMPHLEELDLLARANCLTELFALPTLDHLRVLKAYHNSQVHRLDLLAANPAFRHLTHLLLHPHALAWHDHRKVDEKDGFRREDGYLPLRMVEALVRSPNLPNLQYLQLRCSSMGDEGIKILIDSGMLRRLKRLDLRHGRVGDEGARLLADCPDVRALGWLDLSYNSLSEDGVAVLERLGVPGVFNKQHGEQDEDEDGGYLHEGDIE